jgi:hypothetical protein
MTETEDRAVEALIGLAVGEAIRTTLEFGPWGTYPPLADMIDGSQARRVDRQHRHGASSGGEPARSSRVRRARFPKLLR